MDILKHARKIVFKRSEERNRQYGDFTKGIEKTAAMASLMSNKEITTDDVYNVMVSLKLTREAHAHKYDNILDAIAYLAQKDKHR